VRFPHICSVNAPEPPTSPRMPMNNQPMSFYACAACSASCFVCALPRNRLTAICRHSDCLPLIAETSISNAGKGCFPSRASPKIVRFYSRFCLVLSSFP
jgi:hypothetical protein